MLRQLRREFILDGKKFDDLESFFCEVDNIFTKDCQFKTGHNFDAFNDILQGGFGVHEYGEQIKIIWRNFAKSRQDLGQEATIKHYERLLLIICDQHHVNYIKRKLEDTDRNTHKGVAEKLRRPLRRSRQTAPSPLASRCRTE